MIIHSYSTGSRDSIMGGEGGALDRSKGAGQMKAARIADKAGPRVFPLLRAAVRYVSSKPGG